jgi:hypothetical protein
MLNNMLFSKKETPYIPVETLRAVENKKQEEIAQATAIFEWIQTVTISDATAIFAELLEEPKALVRNVDFLDTSSKSGYYAVIEKVEAIARMWNQIDKTKVTSEQAVTMYNCINDKLPNILAEYVHNANTVDIYHAYEGNYNKKATKPLLAQVFRVLHEIKLTQKQVILPALKTVKAPNGIAQTFPKFHTNSLVLNAELLALEEIWVEVTSKSNSVEDEYLLEEIATNYLPEAWKMYSTFRLAKSEYARKAEAIIIEQVTLLKDRVQTILDSSFESMLTTLEAQTDFLKVKLEEDRVVEKSIIGTTPF